MPNNMKNLKDKAKIKKKMKSFKKNNESLTICSRKKDKLPSESDSVFIRSTSNATVAKDNEIETTVDPVLNPVVTFKWIIDPISPAEFFSKYWEKNVLHIKRKDEKYYKELLTSEELDTTIRANKLFYTTHVDVVDYRHGAKTKVNAIGRAMAPELWDFYKHGCSIRILNPQTYCQKVHSLICSLQEYFGTMVGSNVYLTPDNSQGFAPHFDDIEAFIIQLEGTKYWKLYKPKDQYLLTRDSSEDFEHVDIGEPFLELALKAGDILYLPRGIIHEASTKNMHSLHITVSTYQHTAYIDLLEKMIPDALKAAAKSDIAYRKGLPLNYLKDVGVTNKNNQSIVKETIVNTCHELISGLSKYIDVDAAADKLGQKFMAEAMPILLTKNELEFSANGDGEYLRDGIVHNRVLFDLNVSVRLLRYHVLRMVLDENYQYLLYYCVDNAKIYRENEEQMLEIDDKFVSVIQILQRTYPEYIKVEDLKGDLTEEEILCFTSDLWERGILITQSRVPQDSTENIYAKRTNS